MFHIFLSNDRIDSSQNYDHRGNLSRTYSCQSENTIDSSRNHDHRGFWIYRSGHGGSYNYSLSNSRTSFAVIFQDICSNLKKEPKVSQLWYINKGSAVKQRHYQQCLVSRKHCKLVVDDRTRQMKIPSCFNRARKEDGTARCLKTPACNATLLRAKRIEVTSNTVCPVRNGETYSSEQPQR